jgi:glutamate/tyrosine decarboxylase-like PLP-dependent enzyme
MSLLSGKGVLPAQGRAWEEVRQELVAARQGELIRPELSHDLMTSYHLSDDIETALQAAYSTYLSVNAIYSGDYFRRRGFGFNNLTQLESDVIGSAAKVLGGNDQTAGTFTSGGSESILLAVLSAREWAKVHRPGAKHPTLLLPQTAHPGFNKAAHYLGMTVRRIPVQPNGRADVAAMADAWDSNVIFMVGSAPCWPFGVVDPIPDLGQLARQRETWLHVDSCVGGFLYSFARKKGLDVPAFDLSVEGVSSMSVDLHKYGYAAKGASVILFRDGSLRDYSNFTFKDWASGTYSVFTVSGSRTGGSIAAAWTALNMIGEDGYLRAAETVMKIHKQVVAGIEGTEGLRFIVKPDLMPITFTADGFDPHLVADGLVSRGWAVAKGAAPPTIHNYFTPTHEPHIPQYLSDLGQTVEDARHNRIKSSGGQAVY